MYFSLTTVKLRLIRTPHYHGQFALSLGKESPYICSKFNPLNADTLLMQTLSMAHQCPYLRGLTIFAQSLLLFNSIGNMCGVSFFRPRGDFGRFPASGSRMWPHMWRNGRKNGEVSAWSV